MSKPNTARRTDNRGRMAKRGVRPEVPDHEVLRRLYQLLEESEPGAAVGEDLSGMMREVIDGIVNGDALRPGCIDWSEIFDGIDWAHAGRQDGPRCGIRLLKFMGYLGQALEVQGEVMVPVVKAIELMIDFQDVTYLQFGETETQWWIESTPEGTKAFGFPVHINLPKPPPVQGFRPIDAFEDLAGDGCDDEWL